MKNKFQAPIWEKNKKTTNKNLRPQEWPQTLVAVALAVGLKSSAMAVELWPLVQHWKTYSVKSRKMDCLGKQNIQVFSECL